MLIIESSKYMVTVNYWNIYPEGEEPDTNYFIGFWNEFSKVFIPCNKANIIKMIDCYKQTSNDAIITEKKFKNTYSAYPSFFVKIKTPEKVLTWEKLNEFCEIKL